ncbi:BREX-1 system adenine-specific DNA-methyltransferase PglX, partial [Gordonibacter sp.]
MNDTAIKNFCTWARTRLMEQVSQQAIYWDVAASVNQPASAEIIDGRVLSGQECRQRADLLDLRERIGYEQLVDRAAYTWFNRMIAIRFMELNDRLPSRVRLFSSEGEGFRPQALREALDLHIEGLDTRAVAKLVGQGSDEALFRYLFLAQCRELSACMPDVFEPVGSALELLLPEGLLRADGVLEHLVLYIPEDNWREGVEIVGWMYQYYVSERKDEVFASFKKGKKAEADALAPATQLFTPEWIVRYLVENSLGRLWMLNYPASSLSERMDYYLANDDESEAPYRKITSPEEITVIDPACGSGHILVYAFDLLAAMYEDAGYARRDVPHLILKNNLFGAEIDPRAAAMASFALMMKALEYDARFLRRVARPQITCLKAVKMDDELLLVSKLTQHKKLLDAMEHADECGSLFAPSPEDIAALDEAKEDLSASGDLFAAKALEKVETMLENCRPLAETYDVVVANPPYMGGKNMNKWLSDWVKSNYSEVKGDLFSCFMVRNSELGRSEAQIGMMTPYVWMFISTYEKLRHFLTEKTTITSLIQLEYSGFSGATVPICTFTFQNGHISNYRGGYIRLSDFVGAKNQAPKTLEAIANPDCGWFYRCSAGMFADIPGTPIAYWATPSMRKAF